MNKNLTNNECVILGLLAEADCYGYQLEQKIAERGMREWTEIGFSSIYYLLKKLETDGLILGEKVENTERPAKKLYHLAPNGWAVLEETLLGYLGNPRPFRPDMEIGLAFCAFIDPGKVKQQLIIQRRHLIAQIEEVRNKRDSSGNLPENVQALFSRSLQLMNAELDWLTDTLEKETKIKE
ncbi:MAG: hypothetical protein CVU39_24795 [Chloroflexi bacterium HGW-Chloroflexi-10]|nr:MAG: hypothetical protein CVU39_24795 [Chloroflexi bacterium HGW-Chloroflexi-10]